MITNTNQFDTSGEGLSGGSGGIKDKYEKMYKIGEGAYGTVYKCRIRQTGQYVAIKRFTEPDSVASIHKMAIREIRMLRLLQHPNLIGLLEIFKRKHHLHLVFQYIDHTLLHELEMRPYRLNRSQIKNILYQIILGINYCHKLNIIHRDIKPENILLTENHQVKICDFGFARPLVSSTMVYTDYVATRWYRSPELLVGDIRYGTPVDVWAIGCVYAELIAVQPLWPGKSDLDQLFLIVNTLGSLPQIHRDTFKNNSYFQGFHVPEPTNLKTLEQIFVAQNQSISKEEISVIYKCFQMDPSSRASCDELLREPLFGPIQHSRGGVAAVDPMVAVRRDSRQARWLHEMGQRKRGFHCDPGKRIGMLPSLHYYPGKLQFPERHLPQPSPSVQNISPEKKLLPPPRLPAINLRFAKL